LEKIQLLTKIHSERKDAFLKFKEAITAEIADLTVTISSIILSEEGFVQLELRGEEEIVARNYLAELFGETKALDELVKNDTLTGYVCSSGDVGFGFFVDIGIKTPYQVDALIPLFHLREQLTEGLKFSTKKIIDLYGLINNLPLEITVTDVSIGLKEVEARLSDNQVLLFEKWIDEGLDKLYIIGATEEEIERALQKTQHFKDIIRLETLGWMEHIITCKFNTTAKGLIPEIGTELPKARFEIFSPTKIRRTMSES
jgi:hypothetical protein